jgi:hypothetical protein
LPNKEQILLVASQSAADKYRSELSPRFELVESHDFKDAGETIAVRKFACAVLDHQSSKLETEKAIGVLSQIEPVETFPIIVLCTDKEQGHAYLSAGAHDYVTCEGEDFIERLNAAIDKSITRCRVLRKRLAADQTELTRLETQAATAAGMFYWTSSSVTSSNFGMVSLQTSLPNRFAELVTSFDAMTEKCLEERMYRVSQPVSADLSDLALQLGALRAGPRDVVEIYGTCLKQRVREHSRAKGAAYADVGQLLALELMGYLVSYYRNIARRVVTSAGAQT